MTTTPAMDRRSFLKFVGLGAAGAAVPALLGPLQSVAAHPGHATDAQGWISPDGTPHFRPVRYPLPLPADGGDAAFDAQRLAQFTVQDDLLLPEGFSYHVVAQWGDRFGPDEPGNPPIVFGHGADYTGLQPIPGKPQEFWLLVNHEYISPRPWVQGYAQALGRTLPEFRMVEGNGKNGRLVVDGVTLATHEVPVQSLDHALANPDDAEAQAFLERWMTKQGVDRTQTRRVLTALRQIAFAGMFDLGISVLHVRRRPDGRFEVVADATDHRRINGQTWQNPGDISASGFTGPAGVFLAGMPTTYSNCSGATTPWGTFLTCEENFQDQVESFITPAGQLIQPQGKTFAALGFDARIGLPFEWEGIGLGRESGVMDGRRFGWVCEVNPASGSLVKHTALGRFRHENVALRCKPGEPLAAYMGDDRRGGHVWRFTSRQPLRQAADPANTRLLTDGTLWVARFEENHTGRWIPLTPDTPLVQPQVEQCQPAVMWLPDRPGGGHVAVKPKADDEAITPQEWMRRVSEFAGKPFEQCMLGDLVKPVLSVTDPARQRDAQQAIILMDAYACANAVGGTPTARPEDFEIHPLDGSVYIAFTDHTGSGEGGPDVRAFPDSRGPTSRRYGAIYRLVEDGDRTDAATFTWGRFVSSGEIAEQGGGFACADNLVFDPQGNLWMVCDISTVQHNMAVERDSDGGKPGSRGFMGVFGNNAMFVIPTRGPQAGVPVCFAIGPAECELTGPTFTDDGRTLILAVQHPGELHGTRGLEGGAVPSSQTRRFRLAARDGTLFDQQRQVPLGSNFPHGKSGQAPRPCVVCITREA